MLSRTPRTCHADRDRGRAAATFMRATNRVADAGVRVVGEWARGLDCPLSVGEGPQALAPGALGGIWPQRLIVSVRPFVVSSRVTLSHSSDIGGVQSGWNVAVTVRLKSAFPF
jgi:hypothetical protein